MELSDFFGKSIMSVLEQIKLMSPVVEYSKIESDEFVKAPELGFYLHAPDGDGVVAAYRIFFSKYDEYFPADNKIKSEYKNFKSTSDFSAAYGNPLKTIRSIKIPGREPTLPGEMYKSESRTMFVYHYPNDNEIIYVHVEKVG